jgi:hypothetical protein
LESSVFVLICWSGFTVRSEVTEMRNLNGLGVIGSHRGRAQVAAAFNYQRQDECCYYLGQACQNTIRRV